MKKTLLTSLACGALTSLLFANARLQIVHNSPDPGAKVVDIYVNNGAEPAVDDLGYRNATGFIDLPSGQELEIDIAPGNSTSADQAVETVKYTLEDGKTYYLVADGLLGNGFNTYVLDAAKENASVGKTNLAIYHGSLDAGIVDVRETSLEVNLGESLEFGKFVAPVELDSDDYFVELRDENQTKTIAAFDVPLSAFDGQALLAVASGYAAPQGDEPAFGLFAVSATGGEFIPLNISTAQAQIIHNSPVAGKVDIYINDQITALTEVPFRFASPYVEIPVGLNQKLSVNLTGTDTEAIAANANIRGGGKYTVIAGGDGNNQDLGLSINPMARMTASEDGNTDVSIFHGSTDAPAVDVTLTDGSVLVGNLAYGSFSDGYLELETADYVLQVRSAGSDAVVETYDVPLETLNLEGEGLTVVASGYLNPVEDEPAFGLFVALKEGGELVSLPVYEATAKVQIIHNSPDPLASVVDIYLNNGDEPAVDDLGYREATPFVEFPAGVELEIDIAQGTSTSADDAVATFNYTFEDGKTYYLIADDLVENLTANIFSEASETSPAGTTALTVYHGSPDAGPVDVQETSVPALLADDFAFGDFSSVFELTSTDYYIEVRDPEQTATVAAYDVELAGLEGQGVLAIASGYAAGDNANFGVFAVPVTGGEFIALEVSTAKAQIIHNSPVAGNVDIYINDEITALTNVPFRFASDFVDVPVGLNQKLSVYLAGTDTEAITTSGNIEGGENYTVVAAGDGVDKDLEIFVTDGAQLDAEDGQTEVTVFHGSTDAPVVDVTLTNGDVLISDLDFGDFSEYLDLATDDYVLQVRIAADNSVFKTYSVPLAELGLGGQALTVVASGYVAPEEGEPAFGLFVALTSQGALIPLQETVATSTVDAQGNSSVAVYPNPTNGIININGDITNYQITNSLGSVVAEGSSSQVDLTDLPTGIYIINLQGANFSTQAKIIKK